jgi:para-aminobenzoate synthetase
VTPILLIDNYDSFTFNLRHLLAAELGELPTVCHNDEIPFAALRRGEYRALVISPGPGRPGEVGDFGGCREAILEFDLPVLGVCLGHQGIATAFGGSVELAPAPVHGEATAILHSGAPMFAGLPERFEAVRYHSWVVAEPLPDCLEVTARAADGAVMALAHRERPIWGVQFHPESIGTGFGAAIVRNFVAAAGGAMEPFCRGEKGRLHSRPGAAPAPNAAPPTWDLVARELDGFPDPGRAFAALFGEERNAFWLDDATGTGRSFIGCSTGAGAELLTQKPGDGHARVDGGDAAADGSIFDLLRRRLRERRIEMDLPLDLPGGYVGYFGYGLKSSLGSPDRVEADTPDACFMAATRIVAFDHRARRTWVLGILPPGESREALSAEVDELCRQLEHVPEEPASPPELEPEPFDPELVEMALDRPAYLEAVAGAQRELVAGESYELCLTNRLTVEVGDVDPLEVFVRMRRRNPAPLGAFLRFGDLVVLSSSPERFLRIGGDGEVESRPVKGTRARGRGREEDERLREDLRGSIKDRAENLMIVDLLRNDLSRVCEVGSVRVDELFGLETHPHVHQLVSTIRGRLQADRDPLACVEASFPGGSMTGAPKLRSMLILDRLEPEPRGIYSGALGYLGLGGEIDLSIVIRTAVLRDGTATVGSGGAITVRSDPEEEWEEMLVKARPTLDVLCEFARRTRHVRSPARSPAP